MVLTVKLTGSLWKSETKPVHPKGNQSWIFTGRTDAEPGVPILWPPDEKSWLIGKDPDAGKDWRQEEKGMTENETVGWHHWLNGHECEQALGVSWWWTGKPGALQSMGLQRVRHDFVTEQQLQKNDLGHDAPYCIFWKVLYILVLFTCWMLDGIYQCNHLGLELFLGEGFW